MGLDDPEEVPARGKAALVATFFLVLATLLFLANLVAIAIGDCAKYCKYPCANGERIVTMGVMTLVAFALPGVPGALVLRARGNGLLACLLGVMTLLGQIGMVLPIGLSTLC